jgi:hypothetical protein
MQASQTPKQPHSKRLNTQKRLEMIWTLFQRPSDKPDACLEEDPLCCSRLDQLRGASHHLGDCQEDGTKTRMIVVCICRPECHEVVQSLSAQWNQQTQLSSLYKRHDS